MPKSEILFDEMEAASARLEDVVCTLGFFADEISRQMLYAEASNGPASPGWVRQRCSGLFLMERELRNIQESMQAAITAEMERRRDVGL